MDRRSTRTHHNVIRSPDVPANYLRIPSADSASFGNDGGSQVSDSTVCFFYGLSTFWRVSRTIWIEFEGQFDTTD